MTQDMSCKMVITRGKRIIPFMNDITLKFVIITVLVMLTNIFAVDKS
jgi:hypothetical protein